MFYETEKLLTYLDLETGRKVEFTNDCKSGPLKGGDEAGYLEIDIKALRRIFVNGKIAAGLPVSMGKIFDELYLPQKWFSERDEYFSLVVEGDSMTGAGINDGDLVVIRKQNLVASGNIIAVAIDDNATLKRFVVKGEDALLISENPAYDPIAIDKSKVRILGVAIGVITR